MISIIAYGILGSTYRQEVVVDVGAKENGSLKVIQDIRRQLSIQYGDDTPMTGWALQPAPSGVWLTRIERAFDANYVPAYIAIAFLIPHGRQPKGAAMLKLITDTLTSHHSDYIRQSVIQSMVDWRFLEELSEDLEAYLMRKGDPKPTMPVTPNYGIGFTEDDIATLLGNLWDIRIAQFRMVFCGREILSEDKAFIAIEDVLPVNSEAVEPDLPSEDTTMIDYAISKPSKKQDEATVSARNDSTRAAGDIPQGQEPPLDRQKKKIKNSRKEAGKQVQFNRKGLFGAIAVIVIVIIVVAVQMKPKKQDLVSVEKTGTESVVPEVVFVDTVITKIVPIKTDSVKHDLDKIDMGFTSENGNKLYWAIGNMTSEYTIAKIRSKKGALFYWGEISYTSTGDFRDLYYDDWYKNKGWKKSSMFAGPNPPACISGTKYDVAHVKMGGDWRLPTKKEFQDLIKNSTVKRATENGQKGYLFTSKINGNTLFFPRIDSWQGDDVGSYWSGTLVEADRTEAYYIFMNGSNAYMARLLRCDANAIRPVYEEKDMVDGNE